MVLEYFYQDPFLYRKMLMGGKREDVNVDSVVLLERRKCIFTSWSILKLTSSLFFLFFFFMKRKNIMKFESKYS